MALVTPAIALATLPPLPVGELPPALVAWLLVAIVYAIVPGARA